ncbi:uncharacterized protein LOC114316252 [Camellia sinensis]|uniref:uncharacterized protein LOC114316252 n=1 Tax=Camellia sinensis TaxID=4442 RepID=UPI001035888F|nr:uncharacterized protein LOC114316252 [Camellia sinensis]
MYLLLYLFLILIQLCNSQIQQINACSRLDAHCLDLASKKQIGISRRVGDLYVMESLHLPLSSSPVALLSFQLDSQSSQCYLWHSRLGHLSVDHLRSLTQSELLGKTSPSQINECQACKLAKMTALPFNNSTSISASLFFLVHTDV